MPGRNMPPRSEHVPVMLDEVLHFCARSRGKFSSMARWEVVDTRGHSPNELVRRDR